MKGLLYVVCMHPNNLKIIEEVFLPKNLLHLKLIIMFSWLDMEQKVEKIIGLAGILGELLGASHPSLGYKWEVII